jgi:pyrroloquinoline-quinone synthase
MNALARLELGEEAGDPPDLFVERLRAESTGRYHDQHPFHLRMHEGGLSQAEVQLWVRNRYYYQSRIPIKDALILAKSEDPGFRRVWLRRISDHDGTVEGEGGLALWQRLGEALSIDRQELVSYSGVLPGVRFACDAYVSLVQGGTLVEAVASSLTEVLAPDLMQRRIQAFERHYPWIPSHALDYFRSRVPRARSDGEFGLAFVVEHARSRADQDRCVRALVTKTEILWHLLDAVDQASKTTHKPR